jgi:hypothetical protein
MNRKKKEKKVKEDDESFEVLKTDPIAFKERNAMIDIFNEKKAKFKFLTCDILKSIFCCTAFLP